MSAPLVSIIIPAFNADHWIENTLESAITQTYPNTEIIVIDDGSTDNTLERARGFAACHPAPIHIVSQQNAGASSARNHGLRMARGEYIQFLDADDLLAPNKISLQLVALASAPPLPLVSGRWGRFVDNPASAVWADEAVYRARNGVEFLQLHYETESMMQPGAWLAPRALLDNAGPWDESLSLNDDGEYFARVMLKASKLLHVPASRCYYRCNSTDSLSRRRDQSALLSLYRSVELTMAHLLAADASERTRAAAVRSWRKLAYELYPDAIPLARKACSEAASLGGPASPLGGPAWLAPTARLLGWNLARRIQFLRSRFSL